MLDNRAYYDEFSSGYERERHHGYHALVDALEVDLVMRYGRGRDCLEAGCGTGMILKEVIKDAQSAVGFDLSPGMLSVARARALPVVNASITDIPFPDESFDVTYSFKVLAHVERIERALFEMARVTRPGGHVIAEFYNPWSLRYLVKRLKTPTAISSASNDEHVYTRYDTLTEVRNYLPPSLSVVDLRGVRVLTPISHVHRIPFVGDALSRLEWLACDAPGLRRLGGFLIVVAKKS